MVRSDRSPDAAAARQVNKLAASSPTLRKQAEQFGSGVARIITESCVVNESQIGMINGAALDPFPVHKNIQMPKSLQLNRPKSFIPEANITEK